MTHAGSLTATTPDGSFTAECLSVTAVGGQVTVTAVSSTSVLQGVQPQMISIGVLGADAAGTYRYGGSPAQLSASYEPGESGSERVSAGEGSEVVLTRRRPN